MSENKFYKVSDVQYLADLVKLMDIYNPDNMPKDFTKEDVTLVHLSYLEDLELPRRSTKKSAGYDIHAPFGFEIQPMEMVTIPTGIKCDIKDGYFLGLFPRSSVGFNYGIMLRNTVGIVDGDFVDNPTNEGHIMLKFCNYGDKVWKVYANDKIAQAIFLPYGVTVDDNADGEREGGIGSTGA